MKNILYIAPQDSLPYTDGGKISIFFPLREFAKKYNVFFAFRVQDIKEDTVQKYRAFNVTAIPWQMNLKDNYASYPRTLFSDLSFKFYKFFNKDFLNKLAEIVNQENIDVVWVCHAQMAKYGVELKRRFPNLKIFLREHNIEYKLVKQYVNSQANIFMKLISYFEYLKTKKYEIDLWKKFNKVFFISDTDLRTAKKYNKNINDTNLIYDGMDIDEGLSVTDIEDNSFIFTGSFTSFQNENNLRYFIKNIWLPFVKRVPEAKLYLTGNKDDVLIKKLKISKEVFSENNIINLGFVEDIKKTIMSKQYVVSPTLYGSGIRLKVLEALSLRKVVFVSDIDYDMASCFSDMENIVHYSNAEDFYQKYKAIKEDRLYEKISSNAVELIKNNFDWGKYFVKVEKDMIQEKNGFNI